MRPVADAVEKVFGSFSKEAAVGVSFRVDLGSQYKSKYFRNEAAYAGIEMSYTFARSPESNGIIERFHRTLEEQVFAVNQFADLEEARKALTKFIHDYNTLWIFHRSGGKTSGEIVGMVTEIVGMVTEGVWTKAEGVKNYLMKYGDLIITTEVNKYRKIIH